MSNERRVSEIQKATVNGRQVKMFTVRELVNGSWLFIGKYTAPVRTANKNLLAGIER